MAAWVRRQDRRGAFHLTPFQEAPSPPMTPTLYAACERAVHVIRRDGRVIRGGRAVLFILERVRFGKGMRLFLLPPIIWVVEAIYWLVANHRPFFARFLFTKPVAERLEREDRKEHDRR
jgi:predicted DCC family thiol-disulfide oxidoreductase YuxK